MKQHKLNIRFNSVEESREWEKKNLVDGKYYKGEVVLMVAYDSAIGTDEVILNEIITV